MAFNLDQRPSSILLAGRRGGRGHHHHHLVVAPRFRTNLRLYFFLRFQEEEMMEMESAASAAAAAAAATALGNFQNKMELSKLLPPLQPIMPLQFQKSMKNGVINLASNSECEVSTSGSGRSSNPLMMMMDPRRSPDSNYSPSQSPLSLARTRTPSSASGGGIDGRNHSGSSGSDRSPPLPLRFPSTSGGGSNIPLNLPTSPLPPTKSILNKYDTVSGSGNFALLPPMVMGSHHHPDEDKQASISAQSGISRQQLINR